MLRKLRTEISEAASKPADEANEPLLDEQDCRISEGLMWTMSSVQLAILTTPIVVGVGLLLA